MPPGMVQAHGTRQELPCNGSSPWLHSGCRRSTEALAPFPTMPFQRRCRCWSASTLEPHLRSPKLCPKPGAASSITCVVPCRAYNEAIVLRGAALAQLNLGLGDVETDGPSPVYVGPSVMPAQLKQQLIEVLNTVSQAATGCKSYSTCSLWSQQGSASSHAVL